MHSQPEQRRKESQMAFSFDYSIDIDPDKSIVYFKPYGAWKKETAERFRRDFAESISPLLGRPWAKFVDLTKAKTAHDEAVDVMGDHVKWSRTNDAVLAVYVLNNISTYRQLQEALRKGGGHQVTQTFRTMAEAERYLKTNWFNLDDDQRANLRQEELKRSSPSKN